MSAEGLDSAASGAPDGASFASRELWALLLDNDREADALGEILRTVTFPGPGTGCYSNFDVRDDATIWPSETLAAFWRSLGYGPDPTDPEDWGDSPEQLALWGQGWSYSFDGFDVDAAWFWDGDGTLVFTVRDGESVLRRIVNTDCKKGYGWDDARRVAALNPSTLKLEEAK